MDQHRLAQISGSKSWLRFVRQHKAWLIVGLMVLLSLFVRIRLREMPLERDEGEYAYAGQLILQGVPPYQEAYNMKLPGTYAAYALIMAVFGQTPAGIHVGVALINAASIVLMFLLGRKLLDEVTGIVAAVTFGLLSLSPSVLGLAGHATHFIVLPALAGTLLLLRALEQRAVNSIQYPVSSIQPKGVSSQLSVVSWSRSPRVLLFWAGLLFGIAFLMKQHGIFFGIFGGIYLLWTMLFEMRPPKRGRRSRQRRSQGLPGTEGVRHSTFDIRHSTFAFGSFLSAFLLPYALTCLVLWLAGMFPQFWFWTVSYAAKYATAVPVIYGPEVLKIALDIVIGPSLLFWILAVIGAMWMWWDERLEQKSEAPLRPTPARQVRGEGTGEGSITHPRLFIALFLICSFASVSVGFHYRNHYFITLLPALALLAGLAVSRALYLLKNARTLELFLALPTIVILAIALIWNLIGNGAVWFAMSPSAAGAQVYRTSGFAESAAIGEFLKTNTGKNSKIAVIGSEPQIFFLSHRRSATGYIYTYPLMEMQSYSLKMQEEMIAQVETNRPEFVVYVNDDLSWLPWPESNRRIFDWWRDYWATNLELVRTINIYERHVESLMDKSPELTPANNADGSPKSFIIFKRKDPTR
jgi:hypothetical protein